MYLFQKKKQKINKYAPIVTHISKKNVLIKQKNKYKPKDFPSISLFSLLWGVFFLTIPTLILSTPNNAVTKERKNSNVNKSQTVPINPNQSYHTLYALGSLAEKRKDLHQAILYYHAAHQKEETIAVLGKLAKSYMQIGQSKYAKKYAYLAITKDPKYIHAYLILAQLALNAQDHAEAIRIFNKILTIDPEHISSLYQLARINSITGNKKLARRYYIEIGHIAEFKSINNKYQESAYLALAQSFYESNNSQLAMHYLKKAYHLNPGNMNTLLLLANLNYSSLQIGDALEHYKTLYNYFPGNFRIAAAITQISFLLENKKDMLQFLKLSLHTQGKNSHPTLHTPAEALGLYYMEQGNTSKAIQIFTSILKKDFRNIVAHYALSQLYQRNYQSANAEKTLFTSSLLFSKSSAPWKAEKILRGLIVKNPQKTKYRYHLARLYENIGRYYHAILQYQFLHKKEPQNINYKLHLAYLYGLTNQYARSHTLFSELIQKMKPSEDLHYFQELIYYKQENYTAAEKSIKQAIQINAKDDFLFQLAAIYERQGKLNLAIPILKKLIASNPGDARVYNFLGYIYAERNQNLDEAMELILKAIEHDPENAAYQDSLGWAYFQKGNLKRAQLHVQLAIKYFQREKNIDPVAYEHLGDILAKKGRHLAAIRAWEKGLYVYKKEKKPKDTTYHKISEKISQTKIKINQKD